jgi:hypothetical protein
MKYVEKGNDLVKGNIWSMPSREKHRSVSAVSAPLRSLGGVGPASTFPLHKRETMNAANTKVRGRMRLGIVEHFGYFETDESIGDECSFKYRLLRACMYREN